MTPRCQEFSGRGLLAGGPCREWGALGRVDHQGAFVVEAHFLWDPVGGDDVFRENREWIGGVGWDPLTDGGPWRVDRLESIDVEWGIGRWGDVDESLPEGVETEEEFDGFRAGEGLHWAESAVAMRALEGVDGPDGFDEVAPERANGAGGGFFGWRDKEDLGGLFLGFFGWRLLGAGWGYDDRVSGAGGAAGAVGIEAVVADRLTASMRGVAFARNTLPLIAAGRC